MRHSSFFTAVLALHTLALASACGPSGAVAIPSEGPTPARPDAAAADRPGDQRLPIATDEDATSPIDPVPPIPPSPPISPVPPATPDAPPAPPADLGLELAPEAPADRAPERPRDTGVDLPREAAPDRAAELPREATPELPREDLASACPPRPAADELISSFEDGSLATDMRNGRGGTTWSLINVNMGASATLTIPEQDPICGSRRALRFAGIAAVVTPIARIQIAAGSPAFFDARANNFLGLRFALRAGVASRVRLKLSDRNTAAAGGVCTVCSDHFGADLEVGVDWRYFTLPFSSLRQTGIGDPKPPAVASNALYGIEFVVRDPQVFELFIDDVAFYR